MVSPFPDTKPQRRELPLDDAGGSYAAIRSFEALPCRCVFSLRAGQLPPSDTRWIDAILLCATKQVVADGRTLHCDVLTGGHEFVPALFTLHNEHERPQ
jgi:hypothetical protein